MAKSPFAKRDEQRDVTRRALIKWTLAAGAAYGVSRSKLADIIEGVAGREAAEAATELPACRSVHILAGNGGFAWFQLLFPHVAVAKSTDPGFAYHKQGQVTDADVDTGKWVIGPDTPWANLPKNYQATAFMAGTNNTHNRSSNGGDVLNGARIYAIASALQSSNSSIIRAVALGGADQEFGTTTGSAAPASVTNADGFVGLFNSAASRAGGMLASAADADLYKAHYLALSQVTRVAQSPTTRTQYTSGRSAAAFLGKNLASALQPTDADYTRYGISRTGDRATLVAFASNLIVAVKSFKMGLTNCIAMPCMNDDPHGAFDAGNVNTVPAKLKGILDGFMADLKATADDVTGRTLDLDTVVTIVGDTPKNSFDRSGWPDGTNRNANWMYVYSAGHLKSGWFGGATAAGAYEGFNPDGATTAGAYNGNQCAQLANASVAYAIAKRDERAIQAFANGIVIPNKFGRPKVL